MFFSKYIAAKQQGDKDRECCGLDNAHEVVS